MKRILTLFVCLMVCVNSNVLHSQCGNILVNPIIDIDCIDDGSGNFTVSVDLSGIQWLGGNPSFYLEIDGETSDNFVADPNTSQTFVWTSTFAFCPSLGDIFVQVCNSINGNGCNCSAESGPLSEVLPVTLEKFSGNLHGSEINLNWTTSSELNADYFEIQHSTDAQNFNSLHQIEALGFSDSNHNYSFRHRDVQSEHNYYRLKQYDFNGEFYLSDIVFVKKALDPNELSIYPNPAFNELTITGLKEGYSWRITDTLGKNLKSGTAARINLVDFSKGTFHLTILNSQNKVIDSKRILKM